MRWLVTMVLLAGIGVGPAVAEPLPTPEPASGTSRTLVVGTKESPPFAMKDPDGTWTGLSVELWRDVAQALGLRYELREYELAELLAAVERREVDVAVGALTINATREEHMDFSHPIYSTGLSIAVRSSSRGGVVETARSLLSWSVVRVVLAMLLMLVASGAIVWLAERRRNKDQFGGGPVHGIAAGLWWSAVTMTTVGYGDKAPITLLGRVVALAWMFIAIIAFSFFTASITSTLTVQRLESEIRGPQDLSDVRVGTLAGSTSSEFLDRRGIAYAPVRDVKGGVMAVQEGRIDAMVYDAPILQHAAKRIGGDVIVLPHTFRRQDYGFALPEGSELREGINRALLLALHRERWQALLEHYLDP